MELTSLRSKLHTVTGTVVGNTAGADEIKYTYAHETWTILLQIVLTAKLLEFYSLYHLNIFSQFIRTIRWETDESK